MFRYNKFINEFNNSIKSRDTEEKLDLYFYRPFGFIIAKAAHLLKMTPSQLSILGLISGLIAGHLYAKGSSLFFILIASFFFILSGIFDSSDGQLARIANSGSKVGLVIDGLCDAGVTIAVYLGVFWSLINHNPIYGSIIIFLALTAHTYQCAILDFYHREYLYFGYGKTDSDYWNPTYEEISAEIKKTSGFEKITTIMRANWVKRQQHLSTRDYNIRLKMRNVLGSDNDEQKKILTSSYRKYNLSMLTLWRLVGTNSHTFFMILFTILKVPVVILIFDIVIFNFIILIVRHIQKNKDTQLFQEIGLS